ncbi:radical SAM protein [Duganella caerulea]|uniref:radical SAM protein n=1 Tax=Duganella caerulea TaxID=2885762 RepID=UPI00403766F4
MKILDPLPNPKILSLLMTLQCTAECKHCGTLSSPRVKGRLAADVARDLIRQAKALDYDSVVFTGGEPTLYGKELFELIEFADSLSLPTRIVTNGHWAKNLEAAREQTHRFKQAGLKEINFSTGDEHVKFVDINQIIWGIKAALMAGMPVAVMIEVVSGNSVTKSSLLAEPLLCQLISTAELELITFSESPWMPLDEKQLEHYPEGLATNAANISRRLGCDSVINTTTVLADGKIMACCGLGTRTIPELEIGSVFEDTLATVRQRAESDFLKRWIRNEGPERILQWAATKDSGIKWEDQYAHRCQACKRLYTDPAVRAAIRAHHEEKILDVLFSEYYLYNFIPAEA